MGFKRIEKGLQASLMRSEIGIEILKKVAISRPKGGKADRSPCAGGGSPTQTENGKKTEAEAPASFTVVRNVKQIGLKPLCKSRNPEPVLVHSASKCEGMQTPRRRWRSGMPSHLHVVWSQ